MNVALLATAAVVLVAALAGITARLVSRAEIRRAEAEREFQRSLDHLSLLASCGIGTWAWHASADTIDWDASMFDLFDVAGVAPRTLDEFVGLLSRDDRPRLEYELSALPNHSGILDTECTLAGVKRTVRLLARRAAPDRHESAVIGLCEDISRGKAWEEQSIERSRLTEFSSATIEALTEGTTVEAALDRCAAAMIEHLDVTVSRIWTISSDGEWLELTASAGLHGDLGRAPRRIPVERFTNGLIGRPASDGAILTEQEWLAREGLHGFGGYPLLVDERLVGVMTIFSRKALSHATIATLAVVAKQLALGIEYRRAASVRQDEEIRHQARIEAVNQLTGGVAHDFNNLVTAIVGSAELLRMVLPPGAAERQHVDEIEKAATRANDLTRQLVAFSRNQTLQAHALDLNEVVHDSARVLQRLVGERIRLDMDLAPSLGHVLADAGQMHQILLNLSVNARDAMPHGGTVTIQTANVEVVDARGLVPPGRYVVVVVADTGVGIDAETRRHLFEPFFTTKGTGRSRGLGLAIVSDIVKQAGGHITVDSELDRGTRFTIYLPRAADRNVES